MSVAELQKSIARLPADERRAVASFILQLKKRRSPERQRRNARIMRDMDVGLKYSRAQVEAILARNPPGLE